MSKSKILFIFIFCVSSILSGCAEKVVETKEENTQIANPASVYCEEKGGKSVIEKDTFGDIGWCHFEDGSFCEEWAYFRGECKIGEKR